MSAPPPPSDPTEENPFRPMPAAVAGDGGDAAVDGIGDKLFTLGQIRAAAFLSSGLGGAWLIWRNHRALGKPDTMARDFAIGFGVFAVLLLVSLFSPVNIPGFVIGLVGGMAMETAAKYLQGDAVTAALKAGHPRHSHWRTAGVALVAMLIGAALATGCIFLLTPELFESLAE